MKLKEFLEKWELKDLDEADSVMQWVEKTFIEQEKEIVELKRKNQELLAKSYEQIVDEHKPAFCKLAGRDCPALNETEGETE